MGPVVQVNNAGINSGPKGNRLDYDNAKAIVGTNYYGVKNVTKGLLPLLLASRAGARIVNVTSRLGLYDNVFKDEDKYTKETEKLATKYVEDVKTGRAEEEGWMADNNSESKIFMNAYAVAVSKSLLKSQPEDHQILVATFC
ncbi:unnamed protein product [Calypogeia fissa]